MDFETILEPARTGAWSPTLTMEIGTLDAGYVEYSADRLHGLLDRD